MLQRHTWTKAEKLKSRKRIERVFKEGKSLSVFPFKLFYLLGATTVAQSKAPVLPPPVFAPAASPVAPTTRPTTPAPPLQTGFAAGSRHFKKAVDRNRIKRLSREAYRVQKQPLIDHLMEKGLSMALFFVYTGKELPDHSTVKARIGVALQKLINELK
jgi:ribonuclease P protein component